MIKSRLRQPVNFLLSRLLLKLRCMYIYMDRTSKERLQDEKYVSLISNGITTQRVNCAVSWPLLGSDRLRPEAPTNPNCSCRRREGLPLSGA